VFFFWDLPAPYSYTIFSGRTYPVGEMFYIISGLVLIGTAASLLQMANQNISNQTKRVFTQITDSVSSTSRIIDEVSASMEEQQSAAEDVSTTMGNLVEVSTLLKKESEGKEAFNREMKESFTSLLSSIENLSGHSRPLLARYTV